MARRGALLPRPLSAGQSCFDDASRDTASGIPAALGFLDKTKAADFRGEDQVWGPSKEQVYHPLDCPRYQVHIRFPSKSCIKTALQVGSVRGGSAKSMCCALPIETLTRHLARALFLRGRHLAHCLAVRDYSMTVRPHMPLRCPRRVTTGTAGLEKSMWYTANRESCSVSRAFFFTGTSV